MAKLIKCPRCQSQIDVTTVTAGTTVKCSDCGAAVRIPTGETSKHVKAAAPAAAHSGAGTARRAKPAGQMARGTDIFRKMSSAKNPGQRGASSGPVMGQRASTGHTNRAPLVAGGAILVLIAAGAAVFFLNQSKPEPPKKGASEAASKLNPGVGNPPPQPPPPKSSGQPTPPLSSSQPQPPVSGSPQPPTPPSTGGGSSFNDFDTIMVNIRGCGGYDDPGTMSGAAMAQLKRMGKTAYPKLMVYIMDEDPGLSKAACAALNHLTGQKIPLPKGGNAAAIKQQWEDWVSKNP